MHRQNQEYGSGIEYNPHSVRRDSPTRTRPLSERVLETLNANPKPAPEPPKRKQSPIVELLRRGKSAK